MKKGSCHQILPALLAGTLLVVISGCGNGGGSSNATDTGSDTETALGDNVGQEINLGLSKNEKGDSFEGIDNNGIWIVVLKCDLFCENTAPWFLA